RSALWSGILRLVLFLAAAAPPASAQPDVDRLLFEPQLLAEVTTAPAVTRSLPPAPFAPSPLQGTFTLPLSAEPAAAEEGGMLLAQIAAHNQRITLLEETAGSFAAPLVQEYLDLGRRYQSLGRHDSAIEAFADAEHISRINDGLANPALFPIIEASLASHLARGELREFSQKQQTLYELTRLHHGSGSPELVAMLTRLGDWQVTSFRRNIVRQPVLSLSFGGNRSPDPRQLGFGNLLRAQRHYAEAIDNLLQGQALDAPALLLLEQKFLHTLYLEANRNGLLENPDFFLEGRRSATGSRIQYREMNALSAAFINGRSALQRMRFYAQAGRLPAAQQAALLVAEADWHLLFDHHGKALRMYAEAQTAMQAMGLGSAEIVALLAPPVPPQLPTFAALPHSRAHFGVETATALAWDGWIDVSFELTRYGKPVQLTLLGSSPGTDKAVEARLRRLLLASPFRPRTGADETDQPRVYRLRYHYGEAPLPAAFAAQP
ncbi:MAG: hypothetical protein ACO3PV_08010, partial [Pseudohongiellaceae bacterium]